MSGIDPSLDDTDVEILRLLQENARTSNAEIARSVGMAPSAVLERIRKLESRGTLRSYEPRIEGRALGLALLAFIFVRGEDDLRTGSVGQALARMPEVLEVHHIAGEDCYLIKVRVADTDALGRLLREKLGSIPHVRSTRTTIVLATVKETGCLPLGAPVSRTETRVGAEASSDD
jgi:Lrp/AsnC family leucine-responsive transcriptional regulator